MSAKKRTIIECVGPCLEKIKEHAELKEIYKRLAQEEEKKVEGILSEKIEDYHKKVTSYVLDLLEGIKANRETYENLKSEEERKQVKEELEDLERELYCCLSEIFELYHYFRTLEELSDRQAEQALNIPIRIVYDLLLELKKCSSS